MFRDVPECSGMFRDVPCARFYRRPTSTWFGRTEQHDRGHVTPNKFPGPHKGCLYTRLLSKTKELLSFTVVSQIFVYEGLSKISSNFTLHLIKVGNLTQFKTVSSDL